MHSPDYEEFELPLPKKRRLDTEAPQAATNPDAQDDDMEDVYADTSPAAQENIILADVQVATLPPATTASANAAPTLPGLGGSEGAQNTDGLLKASEEETTDSRNDPNKTTSSSQLSDNVVAKLVSAPLDSTGVETKQKHGAVPKKGEVAGESIAVVPTQPAQQDALNPQSFAPDVPPNDNQGTTVIPASAKELPSADGAMDTDPVDDKQRAVNHTGEHVVEPSTNEGQNGTLAAGNAEQAPPVEGAEWKADSSPYESSSEDSSDTSSDDDSDDSDDYEMLDPLEQARRLMEDDGGSDGEGGKKGGAKGVVLRTHNEKPDEVVEKPNIEVTLEMPIEELGNVETSVENMVLIKAKTTGEYQVLESGSLLCLEDRKVIGVVSETLGRVQEPLYCVRFPNAKTMEDEGVSKGVAVYYVPQHSTYVFTQALQGMKGSDASNVHDEEIGVEEMEFSDDEAEAEYKRNLKQQKQVKRAERAGVSVDDLRKPKGARNTGRRNMHDGDMGQGSMEGINYDETKEGDGELYTPLARPANLQDMIVSGPATEYPREHDDFARPPRGGRGRGDRGRGDRGRGGRHGRGDRKDFGARQPQKQNPGLDLSLPPTPKFSGVPPDPRPILQGAFSPVPPPSFSGQPQYQQTFQPPVPFQHTQFPYQTQQQNSAHYGYNQWQGQPQPQQQFQAPQNSQTNQYQYQQHFQNPSHQFPQAAPPFQAGAFVNPAFFKQFQQPPNTGFPGPPNGSGHT